MRKKVLKKVKRVVVKVGSSVLMSDKDIFSRLAREIEAVRSEGRDVVAVSSGAIALGMERLGLKERPATIPERQAVSSIGQVALMARYERAFEKTGLRVAQVLLTHDDFSERRRFLNARNTLLTLLALGMVPVINENDAVSVDEIKFGDNDRLSALVSNLVEADLLIMLSDVEGLYEKDPKFHPAAKLISTVEDIDAIKIDLASGISQYGTGGIISKLSAAKTAAHSGCLTVIASGLREGIINEIMEGDAVGTLVFPKEDKLSSKKHWIAYSTSPTGSVYVDDGARAALVEKGKSLLPSGVLRVGGNFEAGDVIRCLDCVGREFARGIVNYNSTELEKIKGKRSKEITAALGYKVSDELIHRDNLVVV